MNRDQAFQAIATELGYNFDGEIKIGGKYTPFLLHEHEVYISGQIPRVGDQVVVTGRAGADLPLEQARQAAKICAMRALALLRQALGSLDRVQKILRITVHVQCSADFTQHSEVADGASEVLYAVLGAAGVHTRTSVGCYQLPKNAAVELDLIAAFDPAVVGAQKPTLRQAVAEDFAVLASWIADANACARWAGPLLNFPLDIATLPEALAVGGGVSYVLSTPDGVPLGFGQHRVVVPGAVHLGRIIIDPAQRGAGLGRLLCRLLIARALETTSAAQVTLRVYRDNDSALKLYSSLGFTQVEAESDHQVYFMQSDAKIHL